MYKRVYIGIVLRNMLIFMFLLPMLNTYAVTRTNRIPNMQKEKILNHIYESGSLAVLDNPILNVNSYFYIDATGDGEILEMSAADIEPDEREWFIGFIINYFLGGGYENPIYNVFPEDESFIHRSNGRYFYTAKLVETETPGRFRIMVLYTQEYAGYYRETIDQLDDLNMILVLFVCGISLLSAFFEVRPIKRANREQREFFENASHELRTPITVISSVLGRVNTEPSDDQGQWLEILTNEAAKARQLVNDLMFIARASAKRMKLEKDYFRLDVLLLETYISMEAFAMERGVAFSDFACAELVVYGDRERLGQLVSIFLKNAVENTPAGGTVLLSAYTERSATVFYVKDTGKGIAKKDLKRIFRRFYKTDPFAENDSSAGLGLSIASRIVQLHRGKILVDSKLHEGSRFTVKLPACPRCKRKGANLTALK